MKVIVSPGRGEIIEKKSRFLGYAQAVETEEGAAAAIASLRKEHRDARHCCSAYVLGERGERTHCSDDGEPAQTAGRPILDVLQKAQVTNGMIVVVRYFGGVLLGTGGLTRAYRAAAEAALENSGLARLRKGRMLTLSLEYTDLSPVEQLLRTQGIAEWQAEYGTGVKLSLCVPEELAEPLKAAVTDRTLGRAQITTGQTEWGTVPE